MGANGAVTLPHKVGQLAQNNAIVRMSVTLPSSDTSDILEWEVTLLCIDRNHSTHFSNRLTWTDKNQLTPNFGELKTEAAT